MEKERIIKIAIVGPESTGKTRLCEQLAQHYETTFAHEYARTYFEAHDITNYTIETLDEIYRQQLILEQEAEFKANKIMFADTNLLSAKVWSQKVFNRTPVFIETNLNKMNYDLHLLCDIDLPWVADEQRKNEADREELMSAHIQLLTQLQLPYWIIRGENDERLKNAISAIEQFLKPIS